MPCGCKPQNSSQMSIQPYEDMPSYRKISVHFQIEFEALGGKLHFCPHNRLHVFLTSEDCDAHASACECRFIGTGCKTDSDLKRREQALKVEPVIAGEEEEKALLKWVNPSPPKNELLSDEEAQNLNWGPGTCAWDEGDQKVIVGEEWRWGDEDEDENRDSGLPEEESKEEETLNAKFSEFDLD